MEPFKFDKKTNNLFEAILSLESVKEAECFFRDLCTIEEIRDMADRWEIAQLVNSKMPYRDIALKLKTSTTTVGRVATWLNNGMGGYKLAISRLHQHSIPFSKKRLG
ncbi:MAG: YerC/YecD family TrpR-related protein [Patescibacteria group bacterium]|jgi:TrpR-related protein YerC/YecD